MKNVTIKDIASNAGVSLATVDRALNNRGRISDATKDRILKLADEMGYKPNLLASSLRRKSFYKIGIVLSEYPHYFCDELISGADDIRQELSQFNVQLDYLYSKSLAPQDQCSILQKINTNQYDAFAINAGSDSLIPYINRIIDLNIPVATFNSDVNKSKRLFYVGENGYSSGRLVGELMGKILHGKGTVAVFAGFSIVNSHRDRANGFIDYVTSHFPNMSIIKVDDYHDQESEAYHAMDSLLKSHPDISGVFCVSAVGALGVGDRIKKTLSPEDICLIGYDISYPAAKLLREGYCDALIFQDQRKQTRRVVLQLFNLLTGSWKPDSEFYYTKSKLVLNENLNDYAKDILEKKLID